MKEARRQLTLFIPGGDEAIEKIRAEFNPVQYQLIAAHVTLCREDEIGTIEKVIENIKAISWPGPVRIEFSPPERFENGSGVFIPAKTTDQFNGLREAVLKGTSQSPKKHLPHITLMHPRNSCCTDLIFEQIKQRKFPAVLEFDKISLIEQQNGGRWTVVQEFPIVR